MKKALIEVIGPASNATLQEIRAEYHQMFNRDLIHDLKDETRGHFKDALASLTMDRAEYDAELMHRAVKGFSTNSHLLIEILCTRYPHEIHAAAAAYKKMFSRDMLSDIEDCTRGDLEKLFNLLVKHTHKCIHVHVTIMQTIQMPLLAMTQRTPLGSFNCSSQSFLFLVHHQKKRSL